MFHRKSLGVLPLVLTLLFAEGPAAMEPAPGSGSYMSVLNAMMPSLRRDISPDVGLNVEVMQVEGDWAYAQFVPIDIDGPIDWSKTRFAADHAAGRMSPWVFALLHRDATGEWRVLEYRIGAATADWPTWIAHHHPPDVLVAAARKTPAQTIAPSATVPSNATSSSAIAIGSGTSPTGSSDIGDLEHLLDVAPNDGAAPPSPVKTDRDPPSSGEARAARLTTEGDAAFAAHDDVTALARFDEALALHPTFTRALVSRAKVYSRAKDPIRAMADLDRALEIDPRHARASNNRGVLWNQLKNPARAMADFDKAIELDPRMWQPHVNRGRLHVEAKRWDAALAEFDAAIEIDPKVDTIYVDRGNLQFKRRHHEEAIADYGRAFEIKPRAFHLVNRAMAELALGRLAEAVYDSTHAIAMNPKMSIAYYLRAQARFRSKDFTAAIADLDVAIDLQPDARYLAWRSAAHRALARLPEADRDLAEARRLDPKVSVPTPP